MENYAPLASFQRADGAFQSFVELRKGEFTPDVNCFTAACIVRMLRDAPRHSSNIRLIERSLDWLQLQQSQHPPHAFAFWPAKARPEWAQNVPDDLDDTAIIVCELLRHGRIDKSAAIRLFREVLLPNRVDHNTLPFLPPWIAAGSFFTWVTRPKNAQAKSGPNIVDCCVNANIAALIAMSGDDEMPGLAEAVAMINAGLAWAAGNTQRLSVLTPFYPSILNFLEAVDHAVENGVTGLRAAREQLLELSKRPDLMKPGICRAAYSSSVVWHSPAIEAARLMLRRTVVAEEIANGIH